MNNKILLLLAIILISCNNRNQNKDEAPIARVYDEYLYPSDLEGIIPHGMSTEDSIEITRNFIDNWIRKKLLLYKAEENLTEEEMNIEQQIEDLRTSLLIYKYEQNILNEKLDTIISDSEIKDYYTINSTNFLLDYTIVKAVYIKIPRSAPKIYKVRQWYRSDEQEDLQELETYCYENASEYNYFNDDWTDFNKIVHNTPIRVYNEESFLRNRKNIETRDSTYYYFLRIKDYRLANTVAPLEIERANIRSILLNKRRIEMTQKLEADIYNDAQNRNHFNTY